MITDVKEFFLRGCGRCARFDTPECSALVWGEVLSEIREICRQVELDEVAKWGQPTYTHAGRNVVILGAFRDDVRLTFFESGLMKDPEGVLERSGPNGQYANKMSFRSLEEVRASKAVIYDYLLEAKGYAAAGLKAPKVERELDMPDELVEALEGDPELAEAFNKLTPGRQRSYAINLNSAKTAQTRFNRIEKFRPKILAGKGALDR